MSDKPDRSISGPRGATDELEFFDQLAWAVPTAFAGALAAHRFEQGDVVYSAATAYDALVGAFPAEVRAIQVLRPARSARSTPAESGGSRRQSSWESEVEIELLDLDAGSVQGLIVSQGKLLMTLWSGDERWLEPTCDEPPLPRSGRELATRLEQARAAFDALQSTEEGCRFLFVVDLASDASRVKAAAVEEALAPLGPIERLDLAPPRAGVEDAEHYHPALVLRAIVVRGARIEQLEEALRGALYGGGSTAAKEHGPAASSDRFSIARHGLLERVGG